MLYCFSKRDIDIARDDDPLVIQRRYASLLRRELLFEDVISGQKASSLKSSLENERVLVRGSYGQARVMIDVLSSAGVRLVENLDAFDRVEAWPMTGVARRQVVCIGIEELAMYVAGNYDDEAVLFIKSLHKGFSAMISARRILRSDFEIDAFVAQAVERFGAEVIVSECLDIKRDSLGSLEARFICIDGVATSCSRPVFSLRHSVPSRLEGEGREILQSLLDVESFPRSFALDVGVFLSDGREWVDLVEVNPISASTCYANNTVFKESPTEVQETVRRLRMGPEYCYDYATRPNRYALRRMTGIDYSVDNSPRYTFL